MIFPNFFVIKYFCTRAEQNSQFVKLTSTILRKEENFTSNVEEPGFETSSPMESFVALLYSVDVLESSDVLSAVQKISRHTNIIVSVLLYMQFCVTSSAVLFLMVTSASKIT